MRGDTYRVLKIGFAPQRWVSSAVQRAASGELGFVSNMCSMCPHHQVCMLGVGGCERGGGGGMFESSRNGVMVI